jgi:UDP-N-acetylmuramoyl-tripeptide--D-alanyl-D-alanine ligase
MKLEQLHQLFLNCKSIAIDTRKIENKSLFIALTGDRFDANAFAKEALANGASYAVIDNKDYFIDERTLLVEDCLKTLQELAQFHRNYLKLNIIALTGSNGKTTTKELIHAVLSKKYVVKATIGNLNNHIGVPLTLLSFDADTEIGIVEMGANHQKEIEFLCDLAQPDFGYITNFGKAHLEGFGGFEGVIKGKSEMYHFLAKHHKKVFVNLDDSLQVEKSATISTYSFSKQNTKADVFISKSEANPFVSVEYNGQTIHSKLVGIYNTTNINAAIAIGTYLKVEEDAIKTAIEAYHPTNNRSQLSKKGSNRLILDAYNANPSSMEVALQNFIQLPEPNKVAFLGDMFELGRDSFAEHENIIESLKNKTDIQVYFVGQAFYNAKIAQNNFHFFTSFDDLSTILSNKKFENSSILIKGSRGMALERIVPLL